METERQIHYKKPEEIMDTWRKKTIPIYRFSDPEMSGTPANIDQGETGSLRATTGEEAETLTRLSPSNLPRLVDEVLLGNGEATAIFFNYWQRRLTSYFFSRNYREADDLAQLALVRMSQVLPDFENRGEGSFSQQLHSFCFAVARNAALKHLSNERTRIQTVELTGREQIKEDVNVQTSRPDNEDEAKIAYWSKFWDKVKQILPDQQWQIVCQMRDGKQNIEVMRNLGLRAIAYMSEVRSARQALTDQILTPAGLKTIDSPEFNSLTTDAIKSAAEKGYIDGIKILGRWYITEESFKKLLWKRSRRAQQRHVLEQGTIYESPLVKARKAEIRELVAQGLTVKEIASTIQRHPNIVKRTIADMRREGETIKVKRPGPPDNKKDYSEFDEKVKTLRESGIKNEDIAIFLQVSVPSVTRSIDRLSKNGSIQLRPRGGLRNNS